MKFALTAVEQPSPNTGYSPRVHINVYVLSRRPIVVSVPFRPGALACPHYSLCCARWTRDIGFYIILRSSFVTFYRSAQHVVYYYTASSFSSLSRSIIEVELYIIIPSGLTAGSFWKLVAQHTSKTNCLRNSNGGFHTCFVTDFMKN